MKNINFECHWTFKSYTVLKNSIKIIPNKNKLKPRPKRSRKTLESIKKPPKRIRIGQIISWIPLSKFSHNCMFIESTVQQKTGSVRPGSGFAIINSRYGIWTVVQYETKRVRVKSIKQIASQMARDPVALL